MTTLDYHIIILGGGIVGLTLASLLANTPMHIAVLENDSLSYPYTPTHYASRVSAINRASENIFRHAGVWEKIKQLRVSPYQHMQITDEKDDLLLQFDCAQIGEKNLGYILENQAMLHALENHLRETAPNVTFFPHFQASAAQVLPQHAFIQDNKSRKLTCQLLVGADGKASWLRNTMGFALKQKDYDQTALVTHVTTQHPHHHTAYQRFLSQGPLAFLPLTDPHTCSIVWSNTPTHAAQLMALSQPDFNTALTEAAPHSLGTITTLAPRHLFPLHYQHCQQYFQPRVALMGDAAHSIHPMAGLGLNLGLLDAACLAENLLHSQQQQRDLGLEKTLKRYELQQKSYNTASLEVINLLQKFFCNPNTPAQTLKTVGLSLIKQAPFIKNYLTQYALGIAGDLPTYAK